MSSHIVSLLANISACAGRLVGLNADRLGIIEGWKERGVYLRCDDILASASLKQIRDIDPRELANAITTVKSLEASIEGEETLLKTLKDSLRVLV